MKHRGEVYFFAMAFLLLAIVVAGFLPIALARPGGPLAAPLILHIHGAVFLGWFILFAVQARLVAAGNLRLHMTLGQLSLILAAAMIVLGYLITRHAYARPDWSIAGLPAAYSPIYPVTDIVSFVIAYSLGFANRRVPAAHKRLMLLAGILIIDPAASRAVFNFHGPGPIILPLETGLVLSLIVYDLIKLKRPHWTSLLGLVVFIAMNAAKMTILHWGWWPGFTAMVFG